MNVSSTSLTSAVVHFSPTVIRVDVSGDLHPCSMHKLDAGPVRLVTIAHAFNNRVAVLRDGVKSAIRDGRSRKADSDGYGSFMGPSDGRRVSDNIDAGIGGADLFAGHCMIAGHVP